jgi:hypothetical protein
MSACSYRDDDGMDTGEFAVGQRSEDIGLTVTRWVSLRSTHPYGLHELTTSMQESVGQPFVNLARDVNELLTI